MLYLVLCSVVLIIVNFGTLARMIQARESGEDHRRQKQALVVLGSYAVGLGFAAPMIYTFLGSDNPNAETFGIENSRLVVYILLASSVGLLFYMPGLWKRATDQGEKSFWPVGQIILIALSSFVGIKSSLDHLTFFTTKEDGWANVGIMKEIGEITDMPECTSPIAFVRFATAGPFEYRCPGIIVFNRLSSQPFSPWPHQVTGESQQLADTILQMKSDSIDASDLAGDE